MNFLQKLKTARLMRKPSGGYRVSLTNGEHFDVPGANEVPLSGQQNATTGALLLGDASAQGVRAAVRRRTLMAGVRFVGGATPLTLAATAGNGIVNINDVQICLLRSFPGFRLILENYSTTDDIQVSAIIAAAATTHLSNAGLVWVAGSFDSGSVSGVVPKGTLTPGATAAAQRVAPGVKITDVFLVPSKNRADGKPFPLIRGRVAAGASAITILAPGPVSGTNSAEWNPGIKVASYSFQDQQANLATAASVVAENGEGMLITGAIPILDGDYHHVCLFGDSHAEHRVTRYTAKAAELGARLTYEGRGAAGRNYSHIMQSIRNRFAAGFLPTIADFPALTVNDGPAFTQAVLDSSWARCVDAIHLCLSHGVTPSVHTMWPQQGYDWNMIQQQNARVMSLPDPVIKLDYANVVAPNGVPIAGYIDPADNTHLLSAGRFACEAYARPRYLAA